MYFATWLTGMEDIPGAASVLQGSTEGELELRSIDACNWHNTCIHTLMNTDAYPDAHTHTSLIDAYTREYTHKHTHIKSQAHTNTFTGTLTPHLHRHMQTNRLTHTPSNR